jgi:glutathione synthase
MSLLKIAIVMDPVETINIYGDSTYVMGLEACKRGYEVFYCTPQQITLKQGEVRAEGWPITFYPDLKHYFSLGEKKHVALHDYDVVLMRQDPPFDMNYLTATWLLERIHPQTVVINNPSVVRNSPEKLSILDFPEFIPPTLITAEVEELARFHKEHGDIVLKPLFGHGGNAIFRLQQGDVNLRSLLEFYGKHHKEPLMAQPFIPEVKKGDKRVLLIDGEVAGMFARVPGAEEIRANIRVGGTAEQTRLTPRQQEISEALAEAMKEKGIMLTGIDLIGDYLTEINVTSPTGFRAVAALDNIRLEETLWNAIEKQLALPPRQRM